MDNLTTFMKTAKFILIVILFSLFYEIFAEPSYKKWLQEDVVVTEFVENTGSPISPAITICPEEVNANSISHKYCQALVEVRVQALVQTGPQVE